MCHNTQWGKGRVEEVILKSLRSNVPTKRGLDAGSLSVAVLPVVLCFKAVDLAGLRGCSQSGKMSLIGLTDMVLGTESHCPHLKAGFTKHTSAGDIGQMSAPRRRGRGREVPCLARGGRGTSTPHPANLASLCAGLTRGSW